MIRTIIEKKLDKAERELQVSHDYVRYMLNVSLEAFLKFSKIFTIARYRKNVPADIYHVARIIASRDEDCGTCVQIEVNLALQAGVPIQVIQAVLDNRWDQLSSAQQLIAEFTQLLVTQNFCEPEMLEQIKIDFGEKALVELSLAIACSQFMPTVKRTLGFATSCQNVNLKVD